jgi:NTP pyrophosphatase (non-canonical NTP hydrolase)
MTITHSEMVSILVKPGQDIIQTLTPQKADLLHMTIGVSGESGELLDAVKKHIIYNKPLDLENVIEELGDLEFYLEGIRQNLNITREETITKNIKKLSVRYNGLVYTDKKAQDRADKQ